MLRQIRNGIILLTLIGLSLYAQDKSVLKLELSGKKLPFNLTEKVPANFPKVALALSGGGSRSIAQLGVLKAFEENNIPIDIITGTSMGSIIGGLYSAGYDLKLLDSLIVSAPWNKFFSIEETNRNELFLDQKITEDRAILAFRVEGIKPVIPTYINTGQRVSNYLTMLSLNAPINILNSFDDLLYRFRAVSTDLVTGNKVVLNNHSLSRAMRASSSVSLLLPPVHKDSLMLVDGGLVANIPTSSAKELGGNIIIAVNTTSPLHSKKDLNYPWTIADQLVSIPMKLLNTEQLNRADLVLTPALKDRDNNDFSNLRKLIDVGYKSAEHNIALIKSRIKNLFEQNVSGKEIYYRNLYSIGSNDLETKLMDKYSSKDSVSKKDILYDLYNIYGEGNYANLEAELTPDSIGTRLSIIEEKNSLINKYHVNGIQEVSPQAVNDILNKLIAKPYNSRKVVSALLDVLRLYRKHGYSLAEIKNVSFDKENNTLEIDIDEGRISVIKVEGNSKTEREVITREFNIEKGDFFKYDVIEKGLTALRSTNLFNEIELFVDRENGTNKLIISVREKLSSVLRFGLRIDNENLVQASIDLRDENLFGTGTELGAIFSGGTRNRSYVLEHKANRFFDTYLTYKLRAFYDFNDVNVYKDDPATSPKKFSRSKTGEYRQIFYGASIGVGTQVEKFGNIIAEGKYQQEEIKNKYDYTGETYKLDIASLKFSLSIDSQNKYPYPTAGFLINSYYETAQTLLGGDIGYTKFYFDYKSIFNLQNENAFSLRFALGFADKTLPLSQQFSLGGQNSFFGLRDYEFRGRQLFLTSAGFRYKLPIKLFFDTYFRVRYDLGSIWTQKEEIRFKDLRHGIGATLSFNTPIGPADFSIGRSFILTNTLLNNTISWGPVYFYFTIGYYY